MACKCRVCEDLRHLTACGVSEDFIDKWQCDGLDSDVNKAILEGTWPDAVEFLEKALENAIRIRESGEIV